MTIQQRERQTDRVRRRRNNEIGEKSQNKNATATNTNDVNTHELHDGDISLFNFKPVK